MRLLTTSWLMPWQTPSSSLPPPIPILLILLRSLPAAIWHGKYPFGHLGSALLVLCPPSSCCTPNPHCQHEELQSPWLRTRIALQQLEHGCVTSFILILNPKHSTVPTSRKNINYPSWNQDCVFSLRKIRHKLLLLLVKTNCIYSCIVQTALY